MTTVRHDYPDGGGTTVHFQNDRDRTVYLSAIAKAEARAAARPPVQLEMFGGPS